MKLTSLVIAISSVCLLPIGHAQAADDDCWRVLAPNIVDIQKDIKIRSAYLKTIDKTQFSAAQTDADLSVKVLVDGTPLGLFGSYSDFDTARTTYLSKLKYSYSQDDSSSYLFQTVPSEARKEFVACKEKQAKQQSGIHIWPTDVTPVYVTAKIWWNAPPGVGPVKLTYQTPGFSGTEWLPDTLEPNGMLSAVLKREGTEQRMVVNASGGYTDTFLLKPEPVVTVPPQPIWCSNVIDVPLKIVTHIQSKGDITGAQNSWVGTKGQSLRLEGFSVDFAATYPNPIEDLGLEYMCHVQGSGDTPWMKSGDFCGTRGQKRRAEGYAMRLTGRNAKHFDINYWCHIQSSGDEGQYTGSEYCGTKGAAKRMEAMMVSIKSKGRCDE